MPERYVRIKVKAGARKERMELVEEGVYTVSVREKAERGLANERVRVVLARALGVRPDDLRMVKGATSCIKLFLLANRHDV